MSAASANAPLWTAEEAARAVAARAAGTWQASGVSIDSRTLAPGDLFIAIKGPNADGHDHVLAALERGAAAAVVSRVPEACAEDLLLLVPDTLEALQALGSAARLRTRAKVIAITGSVGKTGTKEALKLVLERQAKTSASQASLNNQWGVPLSLARMPRDAAYGVFELGMNHPGELKPLTRLVRPHVAIITTIAVAHSEFFDSLVDIADAKAEIFEGMRGGTAVLNRDNALFPVLATAASSAGVERILGFGAHAEAEARLLAYKPASGGGGGEVEANILGHELHYRIGAPGRHWAVNSLAVLAAVVAVGADLEAAAATFAQLSPPKGRGARHRIALKGGDIELIDDSYNASPASMQAAIEVLAAAEPGPGGRRIAALGDMLELGPAAPQLHAGIADPLRVGGVDLVFTAGPLMASLHEALPAAMRGAHAPAVDALMPLLMAALRPGDVVMVKGSYGSRMGKLVEALTAFGRPPQVPNG